MQCAHSAQSFKKYLDSQEICLYLLQDEKYGKVHSRVYQLGKMRKYIDSNTALHVYKQMILPLNDYADFMVKSGPTNKVSQLEKLHERPVKTIDNKQYPKLSIEGLMNFYRLHPLCEKPNEHTYIYRLDHKMHIAGNCRKLREIPLKKLWRSRF